MQRVHYMLYWHGKLTFQWTASSPLGFIAAYHPWYEAATLIKRACCMQEVDSVDIDQSGIYKYVLLRLQNRQSKDQSRLLVRGRQSAGYHRDIVQSEQQLHTREDTEVSLVPAFLLVQ